MLCSFLQHRFSSVQSICFRGAPVYPVDTIVLYSSTMIAPKLRRRQVPWLAHRCARSRKYWCLLVRIQGNMTSPGIKGSGFRFPGDSNGGENKSTGHVQDSCDMKEHKDRYQVELRFQGLVPEEKHRPVCAKRPEERRTKEGVFWNPPATGAGCMFVVPVQAEHNTVYGCIKCDGGRRKRDRDHTSTSFRVAGFRV